MHIFLRNRVPAVLAAILLTASLTACDKLLGEEVARLPINALSTTEREVLKEAAVKLRKNDEVALWSEMDLAYDGEAPIRFQVQVLQDGQPLQQLEFDPTEKNISLNEVKTSVNRRVNWRFTGKNRTLTVPADGTYTFRGRLVAGPNTTLQIRKAELVLRK